MAIPAENTLCKFRITVHVHVFMFGKSLQIIQNSGCSNCAHSLKKTFETKEILLVQNLCTSTTTIIIFNALKDKMHLYEHINSNLNTSKDQ